MKIHLKGRFLNQKKKNIEANWKICEKTNYKKQKYIFEATKK